ncbi:unnamed protein product [Cyprideis torosa]|uniref:Uncharacterized protein n=1 Tax=Cyprideis torosa TaxID=163714 RepID=A0A7R8ZJU5_9CRUS|nr:unnamed protein product [Cyprideis torosa]CAG0878904.1 unnamed protein product [Cyprideis torosa]
MWALRLSSAAHHKKRVWSWSGYIASSVSLILYLVYSKLEMRASDIEQKALSTIEMKGDLNNTRRSENQAAVVFHLIQRVGSKMLTQFITALSKKRHFKIHTEPLFSEEAEETLGQDFEEATIKQIAAYKMATVHAQELPVLDYHKYKTKQPIMASIIRDPVERLISWFYFARSPWNFVGRYKNDPKVGLPTIDWVVQDYENCVIAGEPECSYIPGSSLPRTAFWRQSIYFCNWGDEDCTPFNGEHALQEAKRNVDAKFAVVGILEDMDTSVQVLEAYIPRFFKGGAALWEDKKDVFRKINQNWHKRKVSQPIRDLVIRNLTNEIEFYEFCKQRLYRQKALLYDRETL